MKDIKIIPALFLAIISLSAYAQNKKVSIGNSEGKMQSTSECIRLLRFYSEYWIRDSLAKSGFRELLGEKVLGKCDFKNEKWSNISDYLGKPGVILKDDQFIEYRYRLNNFTDDLGASGNMFLDIYVKNGTIMRFVVRTIDG